MKRVSFLALAALLSACGSSSAPTGATDAATDRADGGGPTDEAGTIAYPCDPRGVRCRERVPFCPPGTVASIENGCWGPCVLFTQCAPYVCDPSAPPPGSCPAGYFCIEGVCRAPRGG